MTGPLVSRPPYGEGQTAFVGYVYLITNKVNGKQYVGQTRKTILQRWAQHLWKAKNGSPYAVHSALRKYGCENFGIECVEEVFGDRADLIAAEIRHIENLGCIVPNGYNLTRGGDGVDLTVPETLERARAGVRRRSESPEWLKNTRAGSKLRSSEPGWQKMHSAQLQAMHANPEWRHNTSEANRLKSIDPEGISAHAAGVRKGQSEGNYKRGAQARVLMLANDPQWQGALRENIQKGREVRDANMRARDALCSPKELAKRLRKREYMQRKRSEVQ